ncbi:hypothetical protein [Deinococcus sp. PEB2-63]
MGVHSRRDARYRCHRCRTTFTATHGTPLYRLKTDPNIVQLVLTLLTFGCPIPAVVMTFKIDERTLADWVSKAGEHAQRVHEHLVCQGQLHLGQVQADELWCRTQRGVRWLATAVCVSSRLLLWGTLAAERTHALIAGVVHQVHCAAQLQSPVLWATDGYGAWKTQVLRVFRTPRHTGRRGRPALVPWAELHIVQVVKRTSRDRIERRIAFGDLFEALHLIEASQGRSGTVNTAFVERLNATLRTWLPALVRRSRHAGSDGERLERHFFLVLAAYNFIRPHRSLRVQVNGRWVDRTPGMAAGVTDHAWTIAELLRCRIEPCVQAA